jgi:hypothetical protein
MKRFQELRAAGDTEGWARLLMQGALTKEERQALLLSGHEWRAYRKLKRQMKFRDAYEHLCQLRRQRGTYWIAVLVRKHNRCYQAVLTGVGLEPDVPRFELTAEEAEAVRLQDEREDQPCCKDYEWRRVRGGVYVSTDWKWHIEREGSRQWFVYWDGEPWGNWSGDRIGRGDCLPFESLSEALVVIGEMEFRGFA